MFFHIESLKSYFGEEPTTGGDKKIVFQKRYKTKFAKNLKSLNKDDFKNIILIFGKIKEIINLEQQAKQKGGIYRVSR